MVIVGVHLLLRALLLELIGGLALLHRLEIALSLLLGGLRIRLLRRLLLHLVVVGHLLLGIQVLLLLLLLLRVELDVDKLLHVAAVLHGLVSARAARSPHVRLLIWCRHVHVLLLQGRDHHLLLMACFLWTHHIGSSLVVEEVAHPVEVIRVLLLFLLVPAHLVLDCSRVNHLILLRHQHHVVGLLACLNEVCVELRLLLPHL